MPRFGRSSTAISPYRQRILSGMAEEDRANAIDLRQQEFGQRMQLQQEAMAFREQNAVLKEAHVQQLQTLAQMEAERHDAAATRELEKNNTILSSNTTKENMKAAAWRDIRGISNTNKNFDTQMSDFGVKYAPVLTDNPGGEKDAALMDFVKSKMEANKASQLAIQAHEMNTLTPMVYNEKTGEPDITAHSKLVDQRKANLETGRFGIISQTYPDLVVDSAGVGANGNLEVRYKDKSTGVTVPEGIAIKAAELHGKQAKILASVPVGGELDATQKADLAEVQSTLSALHKEAPGLNSSPVSTLAVASPATPVTALPVVPGAAPVVPSTSATAVPAAPAVGDVMDGHKFKGGDPSQQSSWEPIAP